MPFQLEKLIDILRVMQHVNEPTAEDAASASVPAAPFAQEDRLELEAILGASTSLSGRFSFAGRVRVEGTLEGEVLGGELLIVAPGAQITGTIQARSVLILGGEVRANISAEEAIELRVPAVVQGDLEAPQIFLERGVQFSGNCTMRPLERGSSL